MVPMHAHKQKGGFPLAVLSGREAPGIGRTEKPPEQNMKMTSKKIEAMLGGAHLDTATGAPASGPAPLREPEPETPGRRPALRHWMSPLVVCQDAPIRHCAHCVLRCSRGGWSHLRRFAGNAGSTVL